MKRDWSRMVWRSISGGRILPDPVQTGLDRVYDGNRVGSGLLPDTERDGGPAVQARNAARLFDRIDHAPDVVEGDDRSFAVRQDDPLEIIDIGDPPHGAQRDFRRPGNEGSARDLDVLALHRSAHVVDRQAVGTEAVGIQQKLDLAAPFPGKGDVADILYGLEFLLDFLVGDLGDLFRRPVARDGDGQDR